MKKILRFFGPIWFGSFFQQLYNSVDAVIIGRFEGKEALAAVGGTTASMINLLVGLCVGIASGGTVLLSQYYGARNQEGAGKTVHTGMLFSLMLGIVFMLGGMGVSPWYLTWSDVPAEVKKAALSYLRIYFLGMPFNLLYNTGAGMLQAVGDSGHPFLFLATGCVCNIVLDLILVAVFPFGAAGAAAATILSLLLSALIVVCTLMRTKDIYGMKIRQLRIDPTVLKRLLLIGMPAGLQSVMYAVSNIAVQKGVNGLGTDVIAAWTVFGKVENFFWMMINAFGITVTAFVGQNWGAGKKEEAVRIIRKCILLSVVFTLCLSGLLYLFGGSLFHLFTKDQTVMDIGLRVLHWLVPMEILYVAIEILSGALRGIGDTWIPMLICFAGICVLRVVWMATVVPAHPSILVIGFCYPVTWVVTGSLFILYFCCFSAFRRKKEL